MGQVQRISDRISLWDSKEELRVEITQGIEQKKVMLLILWLVAWTFCGVVFVVELIKQEDPGQQMYFGVLIGAWAFMFYRILRVTIWRLKGKEILILDKQSFRLRNAFGKMGKTHHFGIQHVKSLRLVKRSGQGFFEFMENSFWVIGNDKFEFNHMGKTYQFGKQLNEVEIKSMKRIMDKAIRRFS